MLNRKAQPLIMRLTRVRVAEHTAHSPSHYMLRKGRPLDISV